MRVFVALIIGVAIGLGIGLGVAGSPAQEAEPPELGAGDIENVTGAPESSGGAQPPERTTAGTADSGPNADFRSAAADVRLDAPITGAGVITGEVLLESGEPLAGVQVRAVPTTPEPEGAVPESPDAERRIRDFARRERHLASGVRSAATDANGRFSLRSLADRQYEVACMADGFVVSEGRSGNAFVWPGRHVVFEARRAYRLRITVVDPAGVPATDVGLGVREDQSSRWSGGLHPWKGNGHPILLPAGVWLLQASRTAPDGLGVQASPELRIPVGTSTDGRSVTLKLGEETGLGVLVEYPRDALQQVATVSWRKLQPGESASASILDEGARSETNYGPAFVIEDLEPGRYAVGAQLVDWGGVAVVGEAEVREGLSRIRLKIPNPGAERFVRLRVVDAAGAPLRRLALRIHASGGSGPATAVRRPGGVWTVLLPIVTDADGAKLGIAVSAPGRASRVIDVTGKGGTEIRVQMGSAASLRLKLAGYAGSKYEGRTMVAAAPADPEQPAERRLHDSVHRGSWMSWEDERVVSTDGECEFAVIEAGEVDVAVYVGQGTGREYGAFLPAIVQRIRLNPGANRVELSLPQLSSVRVRCPGGYVGSEVQLGWPAAGQDRCFKLPLGEDLSVVFGYLPPGHFTFDAWGGRNGTQVGGVTVPGPGEITMVDQKTDAFRIVLHHEPGTLQVAGFRSGDHIVAIDGVEIRDGGHGSILLAAAKGKAQSTYTVQRDLQRLDITVAAAEMFGKSPGGSIEAASRPR